LPKSSAEDFPSKKEVTLQLRAAMWAGVIVAGLLQFWAHRNAMNPDGISYIEMAQGSIRTDWHALVNGYWSPLYPFLISVALRVLHPGPEWEFTVVHGVNFVLYVVSFACFEIFLKEIVCAFRAAESGEIGLAPTDPRRVWIWCCAVFLWASHYWLSLRDVVPDLCVAAVVYAATAILLRVSMGRAGSANFMMLGGLLGVGYLAKAAMFPLAFVFLLCNSLLLYREGVSLGRLAAVKIASGLIFAAICAPLIFALWQVKGRVTIGDSGKIAYAEYVDKATLSVHWQGEPSGTGIPLHPTRKIMADPALFEFAEPIAGSYPPWYDPSYWYDGVKAHFSARGQLRVLFRAANAYLKMFSKSGVLWVVALAIVFLWKSGGAWAKWPRGMWFVVLPSIAALLMYSLVLVEFRYVAPFVLVLMVAVLARFRIAEREGSAYQKCLVAALTIAPLIAVLWMVTNEIGAIAKPKPFEQWEVARGLKEMGVSTDARTGFIGRGNQAYWANLAGVRIVSEIPEESEAEFLHESSEKQTQVLRKFAETGASVVVMKNRKDETLPDGWRRIKGTEFFVMVLGGERLKE
jgi:hypothetical protein